MRVLFVIDNFRMGGKERRLLQLLEHIESTKTLEYRVVLIDNRIEYDLRESIENKLIRLERKKKRDPRIFLTLVRVCHHFKPDIIHSWGSMPSIYLLPSVVLGGFGFVNGMISNAPTKVSFKEWLRCKLTFPFSDAIVSNSSAGAIRYKVPSGKAVVIANGFDFDRLHEIEDTHATRHRLDIPDASYVVGMVGSIDKRKDYQSFVMAAREILKQRGDVIFLIVGDGEGRRDIEHLVQEEPSTGIRILGAIRKVESIINIMDVGVLSTFTEGLSNSILEYMALGKPVVATDCPGNRELVQEGRTGFLVPMKDYRGLANKINALLSDDKLREALGQRAQLVVRERYSVERAYHSYTGLYQRVAATLVAQQHL